MYRPNFCSDCGAKILRLQWYAWTSRRFCDSCSKRLRKERLTVPLVAATSLLVLGVVVGRTTRSVPPPLIIERSGNSPLYSQQEIKPAYENQSPTPASSNLNAAADPVAATSDELVYICGARTKKGTPCSRRVHGAVRCWQHKGMPAMLPVEKLIIK